MKDAERSALVEYLRERIAELRAQEKEVVRTTAIANNVWSWRRKEAELILSKVRALASRAA